MMLPDVPRSTRGLSPRVRGNLRAAHIDSRPVRSIPAGAGEPIQAGNDFYVIKVYPRGCGGTITGVATTRAVEGLSPRVRGNHNIRRGRLGG